MGQSHSQNRERRPRDDENLLSPSRSHAALKDEVPFSEAHPQLAAHLEERISQEEEKLNGLFGKIKDKPTLAVIMEVYKEMKQNPNWNVLSDTMQALRENMEEMSKIVRSLHGSVDEKRIDEILSIILNFEELLNCTDKTVRNVKSQARIQESNMRDLIKNIDSIDEKTVDESKFDLNGFEEEMYTLSQWMSDKAIHEVYEKWSQFYKTCWVCVYFVTI